MLFILTTYPGIITWIIIGVLAGWASFAFMGDEAISALGIDLLIGIMGAILGGLSINYFRDAGLLDLNWQSTLTSIISAITLIIAARNYPS